MPVETFRTCIKRLLAPKPFFALCCAGVAIITGVSAWRLDDPVVVAALGGIALLVVALQAGVCWNLMQLHYASLEEVKVCRRETEALFSTFRFLEIRAPFPPMMGYACYPDYAGERLLPGEAGHGQDHFPGPRRRVRQRDPPTPRHARVGRRRHRPERTDSRCRPERREVALV